MLDRMLEPRASGGSVWCSGGRWCPLFCLARRWASRALARQRSRSGRTAGAMVATLGRAALTMEHRGLGSSRLVGVLLRPPPPLSAPGSPAIYAACLTGVAWMCAAMEPADDRREHV